MPVLTNSREGSRLLGRLARYLFPAYRGAILCRVLWLIMLAILPVVAMADAWGWDLVPIRNALHAVNAGGDVYANDMAEQEAFRNRHLKGSLVDPPLMYVYSPVTLPILHALGAVRIPFRAAICVAVCILGFLVQMRAVSWVLRPLERRYFDYLAPFALFFPGLLASSNVLSGNVAYVLYGVILLAAARGWSRDQQWGLFYAAVVFASCFKVPYLTLLAIPVLSSRGQWARACLTALAGIALFLSEAIVWPLRFAHYLRALEVMFEWQHDFGSGPAGVLATALVDGGPVSSAGFLGFYFFYAPPLLALLFYLSRKHLDGAFSIDEWVPVLLVGVILLNPRIIEYDVAPLTIPLALIGWRALKKFGPPSRAIFAGTVFVAVNAFALLSWRDWKVAEGIVLIVSFGVGCITLLRSEGGELVA